MADKNFHIINATYIGATNFRGSRCKLYSARFKKTKYIPYDYEARDVLEMGINYLKKEKFDIAGHGEIANGYAIITNTFKEI